MEPITPVRMTERVKMTTYIFCTSMPTIAAPRGFCPTATAALPKRVRVRKALMPKPMPPTPYEV